MKPKPSKRSVIVRSIKPAIACVVIALGILIVPPLLNTERRLEEGVVESGLGTPFYTLPDPIPAGKPGELVRSEPLYSTARGTQAWRILYHSTDHEGKSILVSGTVITPTSPAPAQGRTVVAWGHPTTGTAQRCAPSVGIDPFILIEGLHDLISAGYVVVATDYSGMGADGPPSFLIGKTEGQNVLDAARAAQKLTSTHANNKLVTWGHSQGGHAALFAAQLAASYAPDLELKGVATAAPASNLNALLQDDIGDISGITIGSYAFNAYHDAYRDTPGTALDTILTPAGVTATPTMAKLCLIGQNKELHTIARPLIGAYIKSDPSTTQPWANLLAENTPDTAKIEVPLFVAQGQKDTLIKPAVTADFVARAKMTNPHVTFLPIPNATHGTVALDALPSLLAWLKTLQ